MDTTYPYGYKAGRVVYTVIDDASRFTYVHAYDKANAVNTVRFLQEVLKRTPFPIQKIRTDNGTEFANTKMKDFLSERNISHRTNTPGCPEQNGKIERFHQTLKRAYAYGLPYNSTFDELQYRLTQFTTYYNYKKRHRGLGMHGLTPMQKLEEYALSTGNDKSVTLTL
jgi:transposase InsO family protein